MAEADELLSLFPPGTGQDSDGMLRVGGCRLDEVAAAHGTPALVVAEQAARQQARDYREQLAARWPDSQVAFASKAFPCTAVQRLMASEGLWLDVAGGGGVRTALAARGGARSSLTMAMTSVGWRPPCRRAGCRDAWSGSCPECRARLTPLTRRGMLAPSSGSPRQQPAALSRGSRRRRGCAW